MQMCCLTVGPALMAAAIYLCMRRIVCYFGKENSLIAPSYFARIVSRQPCTPGIAVVEDLLLSISSLFPVISSPSFCRPQAVVSQPLHTRTAVT